MLNIGDPAGAEFQDILAGLDKCVAAALSDPDRLGHHRRQLRRYLTAWAVATNRPCSKPRDGLWYRESTLEHYILQPRLPYASSTAGAFAGALSPRSRTTVRPTHVSTTHDAGH